MLDEKEYDITYYKEIEGDLSVPHKALLPFSGMCYFFYR